MRCVTHPSVECPKGQTECFLCGETGPAIENDMRKFEYEVMARHVDTQAHGIRTRTHYRRLLKRHGYTDDVTTKELIGCVQNDGKRERVREDRIRGFLTKIDPDLHRKAALWRR